MEDRPDACDTITPPDENSRPNRIIYRRVISYMCDMRSIGLSLELCFVTDFLFFVFCEWALFDGCFPYVLAQRLANVNTCFVLCRGARFLFLLLFCGPWSVLILFFYGSSLWKRLLVLCGE